MKISFDFDLVLSTRKMQQLLSVIDRNVAQVFIITSRCPDKNVNNRDLWEVAERFQIAPEHVYMTDGSPKAHTCNMLGIDIHLDDMPDEIAKIQELCGKTLGVLVTTNIFLDMNFLNQEFVQPLSNIQQFEEEFD